MGKKEWVVVSQWIEKSLQEEGFWRGFWFLREKEGKREERKAWDMVSRTEKKNVFWSLGKKEWVVLFILSREERKNEKVKKEKRRNQKIFFRKDGHWKSSPVYFWRNSSAVHLFSDQPDVSPLEHELHCFGRSSLHFRINIQHASSVIIKWLLIR